MLKQSRYFPWSWGLCYAYRTNKQLTLWSCIFTFLIACLPALNVFAITFVTASFNVGNSLVLPTIVLIFNFCVGLLLQEVVNYADERLFAQITLQASQEYSHHLAKLAPKVYQDREALELIRSGYTALKKNSLTESYHSFKRIIASSLSSVTLGYSLWSINANAALVAVFAPLPIIIDYFLRFNKSNAKWQAVSENYRHSYYFTSQLVYQRQGFELASLNGADLIAQKAKHYLNNGLNQSIAIELETARTKLITGIATVAIFATCIYLFATDHNISNIVAAVSGLTSYLLVLGALGKFLVNLADAQVYNRKFFDFFTLKPANTTLLTIASQASSISFNNVNVSYDQKHVVRDLNLNLTKTGFVALVGTNGCGKTSTFKALMGSQLDASGTFSCDAVTLPINDETYQLPYAVIQQEFGRYEIDVRSYLTLGLTTKPSEPAIWQALDKVLLADFVRSLPQGLDTLLGDQWDHSVNLSGGQWQRLACARVFLSDKPIIFLDEPTSAIDAPTEEFIFSNLSLLGKEKFVLVTSHRVSTLKEAACIYVMRDGVIVEQGSFNDLTNANSYFNQLFASQLIK